MTPPLPPDPEVHGWLQTLGVTSLCQWEVLVFCYDHQATLLTVVDFARLLGQASHAIVSALETLEARALLVRSRVSQGACLYQCRVALDSPRGAALGRLLTLAHDPAGLARIVQQLRQDRTPEEPLDATKHVLAEAQQHVRVIRRRVEAFAQRRA